MLPLVMVGFLVAADHDHGRGQHLGVQRGQKPLERDVEVVVPGGERPVGRGSVRSVAALRRGLDAAVAHRVAVVPLVHAVDHGDRGRTVEHERQVALSVVGEQDFHDLRLDQHLRRRHVDQRKRLRDRLHVLRRVADRQQVFLHGVFHVARVGDHRVHAVPQFRRRHVAATVDQDARVVRRGDDLQVRGFFLHLAGLLADRLEHLAELLRHGHDVLFAFFDGLRRPLHDFGGVEAGDRLVGEDRGAGKRGQGEEHAEGAAGNGRHAGGVLMDKSSN